MTINIDRHTREVAELEAAIAELRKDIQWLAEADVTWFQQNGRWKLYSLRLGFNWVTARTPEQCVRKARLAHEASK